MDAAGEVTVKPELVWLGPDATAWAVVDAKYKAERPDGFPDADLYQMLAYCTVLGLAEGHLVYAQGNEPVMSHQIRRTGVTIHRHTLDLSLPPRCSAGRRATRSRHCSKTTPGHRYKDELVFDIWTPTPPSPIPVGCRCGGWTRPHWWRPPARCPSASVTWKRCGCGWSPTWKPGGRRRPWVRGPRRRGCPA